MQNTDNSVFENWAHIKHPLIDQYKPIFLDRGGDNIVYTLEHKTDVVVKINIDSILKSLYWEGTKIDLHSELEETVIHEHNRFSLLNEIYGDQHVPRTRFKILSIPIGKEVVSELCKIKKIDRIEKSVEEVFAIILIQDEIKGLDNPRRRFISGQYTERYELPIKTYTDVTDSLVFKINKDKGISEHDFILIQDIRRNHLYPLFYLLKDIREDSNLADTVKDFIIKTKKYIDRTDTILDLAGRKNFAFLPSEVGWTYKIMDVLYPKENYKLSKMRDCIKQYTDTKDDKGMNEDILMTINFIRVMNGLSDILGLGRIFDELDNLGVDSEILYLLLHNKNKLSLEQLKIAKFEPPSLNPSY